MDKNAAVPPAPPAVPTEHRERRILIDFESPNPALQYLDPTLTAPSSAPPASAPASDARLQRTPESPQEGLWALQVRLRHAARLLHPLPRPLDLRAYEFFSVAALQTAGPARSGAITAAAVLVDDQGNIAVGDFYPLITRWQAVPLDLKRAASSAPAPSLFPLSAPPDAPANKPGTQGLVHLERIVAVGVEFRVLAPDDEREWSVATDTWQAVTDYRAYVGQRLGVRDTFYVQRNGTRLQIGRVDKFEIIFHQCAGGARPWLEITQGASARRVVGDPGTGLMLLDQDQFDALGDAVRQTPLEPTPEAAAAARAPAYAWPHPLSTWEWSVVWTSPIAALVEVKQRAGPYDALGRPAIEGTWRCMVYQTGQAYLAFDWQKSGDGAVPAPVTLALISAAPTGTPPAETPRRLLNEIYPPEWRQGSAARAGMPHEYQLGSPVAMLAKIRSQENLWWRATLPPVSEGTPSLRVFGVGLPQRLRGNAPGMSPGAGSVACELLANAPTALDQAGMFSQYLAPPAVEMNVGELERNFPGDVDNDSLVEAYGFQTIRLANGKASFTLDPQNRPLFYPVFLLTVPAEQRGQFDPATHRLLLNIDGKQIGSDPSSFPRWPDGSFLVQLPWVLNKPVHVEAEWVAR